jgi:hypothetical protein
MRDGHLVLIGGLSKLSWSGLASKGVPVVVSFALTQFDAEVGGVPIGVTRSGEILLVMDSLIPTWRCQC